MPAIPHSLLATRYSLHARRSRSQKSNKSDTDRIADIERELLVKNGSARKSKVTGFAAAAAAISPKNSTSGKAFWRASKSPKQTSDLADRKQAVGKVGEVDQALSGVHQSAALAEVRKTKKESKKEAKAEQVELAKARKMGKKIAKEEERKRLKQMKLSKIEEKKKEKKAGEIFVWK